MGKASNWFSKLFHRRRKPLLNAATTAVSSGGSDVDDVVAMDANKHAIAVAAATAAVAEAALAAAKAAAEVVRLTNNPPPPAHVSMRWSVDDLAAVKIQSAFRGYLARRARRALKGLVKLQALVRGHFVRKQSAEMLRRLQALVRVQDRARVNRAQTLGSAHCGRENSTRHEFHIGRTENHGNHSTLERSGSISSTREARGNGSAQLGLNWLDNWVDVGSSINSPSSQKVSGADDEKGDKILEVDSWRPCLRPKSTNRPFPSLQHISVQDYYNPSFAASDYLARYMPNDLPKSNASLCAEDVASLKSLRFPMEVYTVDSSPPQASSFESKTDNTRQFPMTPMRNEWSRSFVSGYPSPSYMGNTKSSQAKARSQSAPRQRADSQKRGLNKRSLQAFWETKTSLKRTPDSLTNSSK